MKKIAMGFLCILLIFCCGMRVSAAEVKEAADITDSTEISGTGYKYFYFLTDRSTYDYYKSDGNAAITLENEQGMGSLYLLFDYQYGEYSVIDNESGKRVTAGKNGFYHEFIDLEAVFGKAPASVTLDFSNGQVCLGELYVFSTGETPDFVQKWEPPLEGGADILLLPTHGDDDQLFFAGLLPYYAGELGCRVQVAYLTDHRSYILVRVHEMLNGLWGTGVTAYPVFCTSLDLATYSMNESYQFFAQRGYSRDDLMGLVVELLRRFKPQVVVGHDINGEYRQGMHMMYTDLLMDAVEISNDPAQYAQSAQEYGVWDVPKTYLHLLEDNPIEINYDIPLERFDGLTAFQVTQKYGMPCHESQKAYPMFWNWLYGVNKDVTMAAQLETYSPCKFGLYRSTVGADVAKNDFLENITTYAEQERQEQARIEQERLEKQKQEQERLDRIHEELEAANRERLDRERQEKERLEQERREQERLIQEELQRQEEEKKKIRRENQIVLLCFVVIFLVASSLSSRLVKRFYEKNNKQKKLKK